MKKATLSKLICLGVFLVISCNYLPAQESSQARGLDVVGYGYDVFGKYADMNSLKPYPFFDLGPNRIQYIGSYSFDVPENVFLQNISSHKVTTIQGENLRQYAREMSRKAAMDVDAKFFSSSIDTSFSSSTSGYSKSKFFTYRDANTKWKISLLDTIDMEKLKQSMTEQAKNDIAHMEARKFLDYYGSYYVASAFLGGRADLTVQSDSSKNITIDQLSVSVEAEYKVISGSASGSSSNKSIDSSSLSSSPLTVVGGNSEYANNIRDYAQYSKWAEGINEMPVLCDFEKGSLRPVWELAPSLEREAALKAAFEEMKKEFPLPEAFADIIGLESSQYMIQNVASKLYWDMPGYNFSANDALNDPVVLNVPDAEIGNAEGLDRVIKIVTNKWDEDDEHVMFQPQHSDHVVGADGKNGKLLLLDASKQKDNRILFKMIPVDDRQDTYFITNKANGLYLTRENQGHNSPIVFRDPVLDESQMWYFKPILASDVAQPDKAQYIITAAAAAEKRSWDFGGAYPALHHTDLQIWDDETTWSADRIIDIVTNRGGFCYMGPMSHQSVNGCFTAVDIEPEEQNDELILQKNDGAESQKWVFEYAGIPRGYYIKSKGIPGTSLALKLGKTDNGTKVIPIKSADDVSQKWIVTKNTPLKDENLIDKGDFQIYTDNGKFIMLIGGAWNQKDTNGANINIWTREDGGEAKVRFVPCFDGSYIIKFQNGDKVLDVSGGKENNGQNIQLWENLDTPNQHWFLHSYGNNRYGLVNVLTKKGVDIENGKNYTKGDNVQQWSVYGGPSQRWLIVHADGARAGKPF
jgi:hypothetical protein